MSFSVCFPVGFRLYLSVIIGEISENELHLQVLDHGAEVLDPAVLVGDNFVFFIHISLSLLL